MGKFIDITGTKYNHLTAIRFIDERDHGGVVWEWQCDCGKKIFRSALHIKSGATKSCGCARTKNNKEKATIHGMIGTREYRSWIEMKARCRGKDDVSLKNYKERGIFVCERWVNDFSAFMVDMGPRPLGMSLDRIDNDKGYFPENCRWATQKEQLRNTRRTVRVIIDDVEMCLKDACKHLGMNYDCVRSRIRKGISVYQSLGIAHESA